jgi:hypothetical protein
MQELRLLPLAVSLLAAVTVVLVLVLIFDIDRWQRGQPERYGAPNGYVACVLDPIYGFGKADTECPAPGPDTPKEHIVYCRGTSRTDVNVDDCI